MIPLSEVVSPSLKNLIIKSDNEHFGSDMVATSPNANLMLFCGVINAPTSNG